MTRTDSANADFKELVQFLDAELESRYGPAQAFYDQFNYVDQIKNVVIIYEASRPVGCGAFKVFDKECVEIKRMFVLAQSRGKGYAMKVLAELERWAGELGYSSLVLETGTNQPEAIGLYRKSGYEVIPNYGPYAGIRESICMKKWIDHSPSLTQG